MIIYREETLIVPKDGQITMKQVKEYFEHELDIKLKTIYQSEKEYTVSIQRKLTL